MRHLQTRLAHHAVAEEQKVEIDLPRPPVLSPHPAEQLLDGPQPLQRGPRREQRADVRDRVEIVRLRGADRLALVGEGNPAQLEARLPRQPVDRGAEVRQPVAEVRPQPDERLDHVAASFRNRSSIR